MGRKNVWGLVACFLVGTAGIAHSEPSNLTAYDVQGPKISAESAIIIDADSGAVLWGKNEFVHRYPASTTKIMTAILLIENCKPDDIIVAPPDIRKTGESSMHLAPGEKITAHDMLYALLLRSANDGCVAVADHIAGSVPNFVKMMNNKAIELGCQHMHYDNPNGLPDKNHWVTAHDMALIARAAMQLPQFEEVVRTKKYRITRSINQKDTWMVNRDKWLKADPSADGIKTGWTIAAGHCFVGSVTRKNFRVIDVELHSNNWVADHRTMMAWAYAHFEHKKLFPASPEVLAQAKGFSKNLVGIMPSDLIGIVPVNDAGNSFTTKYIPLKVPVVSDTYGTQIGALIAINKNGQTVGETPIYGKQDMTSALTSAVAKSRSIPKKKLALISVALLGLIGVYKVKGNRNLRRRFR